MSWNDFWGNINDGLNNVANWAGNVVSGFLEPITHNNENLQLQKDNLEYQKELQQTIFDREDTAQQRAVADMKAAGLSPTLAAGHGASSGSVVSTSAPQRGSNLDTMVATLSAANQMANISHTRAETARLNHDLSFAKENNLPTGATNTEGYWIFKAIENFLKGKSGVDFGEAGGVITSALEPVVDKVGTIISGFTKDNGGIKNLVPKNKKVVNGEVVQVKPAPASFNTYSDYRHACLLADADPVTEKVWRNIKYGKSWSLGSAPVNPQAPGAKSSLRASSSGGVHGGSNGSF